MMVPTISMQEEEIGAHSLPSEPALTLSVQLTGPQRLHVEIVQAANGLTDSGNNERMLMKLNL